MPSRGGGESGGQGDFSFRGPDTSSGGTRQGGETTFVTQNRPWPVCAARALASIQKWAPHAADAGSPPARQEGVLRDPGSVAGAGRPGAQVPASGLCQAWAPRNGSYFTCTK